MEKLALLILLLHFDLPPDAIWGGVTASFSA